MKNSDGIRTGKDSQQLFDSMENMTRITPFRRLVLHAGDEIENLCGRQVRIYPSAIWSLRSCPHMYSVSVIQNVSRIVFN